MIDWVAGIFAAYLLTWPALVGLFLASILFEHSDWRGFSVTAVLVAAVSGYFMFKPPLVELALIVAGYSVAGIAWSFFRYKRFADAAVEEFNKGSYSAQNKQLCIDRLGSEIAPSRNMGKIVAWIVIWPVSLVENAARDLITTVEYVIKKFFRGVYNKIFDSAMSKVQ